jgi:hypothetical protein
MLVSRIVGRSLDWAERSLPGYAALKLPLYFLRAALFKRISAPARDQPCDDEQDRRAFHLLILGNEGGIARRGLSIADCGMQNADLDERWRPV